jgi:hypothetical protein
VPVRRWRWCGVDHDGQRQGDGGATGFGTYRGAGCAGRADTVEEVSELLLDGGVQPVRWYGVWLFVDWLEFSGVQLDPSDSKQVAATAAVELEASRRDPYRQLSRVFHLVGRKGTN